MRSNFSYKFHLTLSSLCFYTFIIKQACHHFILWILSFWYLYWTYVILSIFLQHWISNKTHWITVFLDIISILHHVQPYYYHSIVSLLFTEWIAFLTWPICGLVNINLWSMILASIYCCRPLRNTSFCCSSHLMLYHGLLVILSVFSPVIIIPHCCTCHVKSL